MTNLCRSHIGLPTGPITYYKTAQISPNGSPASTGCFALLSTESTWSTTFPPCLKIALRKKTEQSLTSSTRLSHLTFPCALVSCRLARRQKSSLMPLKRGAAQEVVSRSCKCTVILSLRKSFAIFKKLGVDGDELEGLLAQAACHPLASLDRVSFNQLVTSAILAKGDEKPSSTFVGQVILNASRRDDKHPQHTLPFVYRVSDPQERQAPPPHPHSPYLAKPFELTSDVCRPPEHLVDCFGGALVTGEPTVLTPRVLPTRIRVRPHPATPDH
ncbi:hypothetical protein O181_004356 [Austropuccinia psidii MF-1]|uniref:Uncharacterized protein n=1 Tax=Austropuccinia psidii MF-1 TaxID=1389203 RepID=A0A9Q3BFE7_9BASI|nr:hypothetical protein [Austropuccinia psidii MF-1]